MATDADDTGTEVTWRWGQGEGSGTITEVDTERVEKTLAGSQITRNADDDNPAYLLEQDDGAQVLKSSSELSPA